MGACLEEDASPVRGLLARARQLATIDETLRGWLPAPLNASLQVANLRHGTLVIHIEHAAAYTTLRYQERELTAFLNAALGLNITKIELRLRTAAQNGP